MTGDLQAGFRFVATVTQAFRNRQAQLVGMWCFIAFAIIGLAGVLQPGSRWEGAVWVVVSGALAVRARRSSNVALSDQEVVTRSLVRTRRFRLTRLDHVEVAMGRTGIVGIGREYVVHHTIGGEPFGFKELNAKPSAQQTTVVHRAAQAINAAITRGGT